MDVTKKDGYKGEGWKEESKRERKFGRLYALLFFYFVFTLSDTTKSIYVVNAVRVVVRHTGLFGIFRESEALSNKLGLYVQYRKL